MPTGRYPYGAAITCRRQARPGLQRGRRHRLGDRPRRPASEIEEIRVGPHLSHPEGIAIDPKRPLAYVAVTHQDLIAVIDTSTLEVARTLSVERPQGIGTAPGPRQRHRRRLPAALGELRRGRGRGLRALGQARAATRAARGAPAIAPPRPLADARSSTTRRAAASSCPRVRARRARRGASARRPRRRPRRRSSENPVRRRGKRWQLIGRDPRRLLSDRRASRRRSQPASAGWSGSRPRASGSAPTTAEPGEEIPEDPGSATGGAPDRLPLPATCPRTSSGMSGITAFPSRHASSRG